MNQHRLHAYLVQVARRERVLRVWQAMAFVWLAAAFVGLFLWGLRFAAGARMAPPVAILCVSTAACAAIGLWFVSYGRYNAAKIARAVEATFPELRSCLLAAVEQKPELPGGRFGYLQDAVIVEALRHAETHPWLECISPRRLAVAMAANAATFSLFLATLVGLGLTTSGLSAGGSTGSADFSPIRNLSVVVEPGDVEIERGTSLLVLARVRGELPAEAALSIASEDGVATRLAMSQSLDDPVFAGRIASVAHDLNYHVELGGYVGPTYRVTVFEYPKLERIDARLVYPQYTRLEENLLQDVRIVSVVEGTEVTLLCRLNKSVAMAAFVDDKAGPVALAPSPDDATVYQAKFVADASRRMKLTLVDVAGRQNIEPAYVTINVLPNQAPTLKSVSPGRDVEVSALEELEVSATVWDDFGVERYGLTYELAGSPTIDIVLGENAAPRTRHELSYLIRLEELRAEPDQLLSYHFWAEDLGPDGLLRRTLGDMYFGEVRPWEEIFREGEQPPGGQAPQQRQQGGENANSAQQLADLQKQIINSTWKVLRRESGANLSDKFVPDTKLIYESQADALEMAEALADRLQDHESLEHTSAVLDAMQTSAAQLQAAIDQAARDALQRALAPEQAAYQALLKLRAREHRISRQQGGGGASAARSQQQRRQLDQLDLKREENRYETQRLAQSPEDQPQDRENRQVLNRLRELSRRQHDLNERLKELQSALEEARTEPEREEVRRQLKRLHEDQRQILRGTEELQSRMETAQDQQNASQERQKLEEAREQARRAADALEQEMVSQAAASGARAETGFEELKDEFRRRASGRFDEEMRDMREAARELDQHEKTLAERLDRNTDPAAPKSLRDDDQRGAAAQELAEQRRRLTSLQERLQQTVHEAEQTEPLLAERLYDAARNIQDQNLSQLLEATERLVQQGRVEESRRLEAVAGKGIGQLREGIERAAEAVLGDEAEALRRARQELNHLSEELNEELARNGADAPRSDTEKSNDEQQARNSARSSPPGQGQAEKRESGQSASTRNSSADRQGSAQSPQGRPREQNGQSTSDDSQNQRGKAPGSNSQRGVQNDPSANSQSPGGQGRSEESSQSAESQPGGSNNQRGGRAGDPNGRGGVGPFDETGARNAAPLSGGGFVDWSDRLRDVEEMVDDPELRAEAARIRERARGIRADSRRHSLPPNWDLVKMDVARPLAELRDRVAQELLRRTSKQAIVPLDRDPVPPRYSEKTRLYYEQLGSGR